MRGLAHWRIESGLTCFVCVKAHSVLKVLKVLPVGWGISVKAHLVYPMRMGFGLDVNGFGSPSNTKQYI